MDTEQPQMPLSNQELPNIDDKRGAPGITIAALIIGIVALLLAAIPVVGIVLGVVALILALIGRKKSAQHKLWIGGLVLGGVATLIGVVMTFIVMPAIFSGNSVLFGGSSEYNEAIQQLEAAPKSFTSDEVAEIGPYDVTIKSVNREATPTESDRELVANRQDERSVTPKISEEDARYVEVVMVVRYDATNEPSYQVSGAWLDSFDHTRLNGERSLRLFLEDYDLAEETRQGKGAEITNMYRIASADTNLTLEYDTYVHTRVSSIVGTEGIPTIDLAYTIKL